MATASRRSGSRERSSTAALRSLLNRVDGIADRDLWATLASAYAVAASSLDEARHRRDNALQALGAPDTSAADAWAKTLDRMLQKEPLSQQETRFLAWSTAIVLRRSYLQLLHLRNFLTGGLLALLISILSYPFEPQRLLKLYIGLLLAGGAVVSAMLILQARQGAATQMLGTSPSRLERWGELSGKLAFHTGLPTLGLLLGRFPDLGSALLDWLEPLFRQVG